MSDKANLHTIRELAERIYELDHRVYTQIGSSLGRVFNGDRKRQIGVILEHLTQTEERYLLRRDLALIGNMARSIRDRAVHREVMSEYDAILKEMNAIPDVELPAEVMDEFRVGLNSLLMGDRFHCGEKLVICISRNYGSGGNDIGFQVADALQINYYDAEILKTVIHRMEAEADGSSEVDILESYGSRRKNNPGLAPSREDLTVRERFKKVNRYHGLPIQDAIFFNQSELFCEMAKKEHFVIIGRCADAILTNNRIPHISIFITAPFEKRVSRMMKMNHVDHRTAAKQLREVDHAHASYYKYYTGQTWGDAKNYDLCINSASFGIQGSVDFILNLLRAHGISASSLENCERS